MKNKVVIYLLIAAILAAYFIEKKMSTDTQAVNASGFFNDLVGFILDQEGGLSNSKSDTASKNPSPTPQKYHTNKGITWTTFTDSASLGYDPTVNNFLKMPNDIWMKIFIDKYYNKAKKLTPNVVLNGYMSLWYWGGWATKLMPTETVAAVLASKDSTKDKLKKLVSLRIQYFNNIVKNNPSQIANLKGWTNRANKFYTDFEKYC